MASVTRNVWWGVVAGAAGTTALTAVTYVDMALRGRPASSTPQQTIERAAALVGVSLPHDERTRDALMSGLGAVLGALAGVGAGAALGAVRGLTGHPRSTTGTIATAWAMAMVIGNGPMTVLGVTDPRRWTSADWAADIPPHVAYAVAAGVTFEALADSLATS
jgi:hypothetical protein